MRHGSHFQGFAAQTGAPSKISDTEVVDTPDARISSQLCGFVPLRGVADAARSIWLRTRRSHSRPTRTIHTWDQHHRSDAVDVEIQPTVADSATGTGVDAQVPADPPPDWFVINTPLNRIVVNWR